jgi:hypothetical protein
MRIRQKMIYYPTIRMKNYQYNLGSRRRWRILKKELKIEIDKYHKCVEKQARSHYSNGKDAKLNFNIPQRYYRPQQSTMKKSEKHALVLLQKANLIRQSS